MRAKDCVNGSLYDLPQIGKHDPYRGAECHGLNNDGTWILFLTFNEWGERKIRMIMPDTEVHPTRTGLL